MYAKCDLHITFCETVCEVVENEQWEGVGGIEPTSGYWLVCLLAMLRWILPHFSSFFEALERQTMTKRCVCRVCVHTLWSYCGSGMFVNPPNAPWVGCCWSNNGLLSVLIGRWGRLAGSGVMAPVDSPTGCRF